MPAPHDRYPDSRYPNDWETRRERVFQRDDYTCQAKGCANQGGPHGPATLHAHHIQPISEGGTHAYENLLTLCESCHNGYHTHDITDDSESKSPDRSTLVTVLSTILFMKFLGVAGSSLVLIAILGTTIIAATIFFTFDIFVGAAGIAVLFLGLLILGVSTLGWIIFLVYSRLAN